MWHYLLPVICESRRVPHVGQGTLTLSGAHDFTSFGEVDLTHSLYVITEFASQDYVCGLMTGLFSWISVAALSRIYCIVCKRHIIVMLQKIVNFCDEICCGSYV